METDATPTRTKRHLAAMPLHVTDLVVSIAFVVSATAYVQLGGLATIRLPIPVASPEIGGLMLFAPLVLALVLYVLSGLGLRSVMAHGAGVGVAALLCGLWLEASAASPTAPLLLPVGLATVLVAARYLRPAHAWGLWFVLCILGGWLSIAASVYAVGEYDQLLRNAPLLAVVYAVPTALLVRFVQRRADVARRLHEGYHRRRWWRSPWAPLAVVTLVTTWVLGVSYLSISLLAREMPVQTSLDETSRLTRSAAGAKEVLERSMATGPRDWSEDTAARLLPLARAADAAVYVFATPLGVSEVDGRLDLEGARLVAGAHRSLESDAVDDFVAVRDLDELDPAMKRDLFAPLSGQLGAMPFESSGLVVRAVRFNVVALPLFTPSAVRNERPQDWRWVLVVAPALPYAGMPLSSFEIANEAFAFAFPWLFMMLLLPSAIVLEVLDRRTLAARRRS